MESYLFINVGAGHGMSRDSVEKNKADALKLAEKYGFVNAGNKKKATELADSIADGISREPPAGNVAIVKKMKADIDAAVKLGTE